MKIKTILFMVLSLMSFTVFAQNNGGVKGKVVSRTTRAAIDGVKVTLTPGDVTTKTDASGNFVIENLAKGEYTLSFEAAEFEPLTLAVRVDMLALARLIIIALTGRHMHDTDGLPIFNGCNGMRRQADYHGTRGFFLILWVASALNT